MIVLGYPVSEFFEFQTLSLKTCSSILRIPTLDSLKDTCSGSFVCLIGQINSLTGRPNELLKELLLKLQTNFPVPPLVSILPKNFKSLNSRIFAMHVSQKCHKYAPIMFPTFKMCVAIGLPHIYDHKNLLHIWPINNMSSWGFYILSPLCTLLYQK